MSLPVARVAHGVTPSVTALPIALPVETTDVRAAEHTRIPRVSLALYPRTTAGGHPCCICCILYFMVTCCTVILFLVIGIALAAGSASVDPVNVTESTVSIYAVSAV